MNKKKIISVILAVIIVAGGGSGYYLIHFRNENTKAVTKTNKEEKSTVKLVIDAENKDELPIKFRTTNDKIDKDKAENVNLKGMSDLNISGSGALSEKGMAMIKENIGNKPIMDVDLRQESHGYINGIGVSWTGKNNHVNEGLSRDDVIADEKEKLNSIIKDKHVAFDKGSKDKSINTIKKIDNPDSVQTEEGMAESQGMSYLRITVADHEKPLDDQVDLFVKSIKEVPKDTWIHFHCRGGSGRTTTFMTMYDMMHNAKNVSFDDILKRQNLIGGIDLSKDDGKDGSKPRLEFLNMFYKYCSENNDNFQTSWSQWKKDYKG